ncbi:hypothetical protein BOX15_Mlig034302g1, partial [Macrostomum lignano]
KMVIMNANIVYMMFSSIVALTSGETLRLTIADRERNGTLVGLCNAETARFGPTEDFYSITGVVVNAAPINGCEPLQPPPYPRNDSLVWIALLARDSGASGCYFDRKILNAQKAGFGAALIYNYENTINAMQASSLGSKVLIPAAMVTRSCGTLLQEKFVYSPERDSRFNVAFREYFSFDFNVYVISFVAIICTSFILFALLWAFRWIRDWRIRQRTRLSRSSLKKLKVKKFEKGTDPYECCAICLEDFEPGDKLRILPCNHAYHMKCIDPWLLKNRSCCPVCKRRVFPRQPGEAAEEGDSDVESGAGANSNGAESIGGTSGAGAVGAAAPVAAVAGAETGNSGNAGSSGGRADGERTPLLSSSNSSSVASGGSFGAVGSSGARAAFDNPALHLQDELASAVADTASAIPDDVTRSEQQQHSNGGSSLSSCSSSSTVSVTSLITSADGQVEEDGHHQQSVEVLAEVCVHQPDEAGAKDENPRV